MKRSSRKTKKINFEKILELIEKIIDHRAFRPISIAILITFLLFNGVLYVQHYIVDYKEKQKVAQRQHPIKIHITQDGKTLDFDQVQIVERRIKPGDNMLNFLIDIGLGESDTFAILNALKKVYSPRTISVGTSMIAKYKIKVSYNKNEQSLENMKREVFLSEFKVVISPEIEYVVTRLESGEYKAKEIKQVLVKKIVKYVGVIKNGLFVDATDAGASPNAVMNMIALYGYDVDFQRDIRSGDAFEILVESYYTENGRKVRDGSVLFSFLKLRGREIEMYAHQVRSGETEYFDKKGNSVRKSLLRTPVNGARISSGFGFRRHPVLGYSKLHKGVDFAAPTGTPIFAAGNGTIVYSSRFGSYGNFVKIKHNDKYSTAYAHASRFGKYRVGSKVKQGDIIAYVGTTGRSTGPHLHFEVVENGRVIDPAKVKAVSGVRLVGADLSRFMISRDNIERHRKNALINLK